MPDLVSSLNLDKLKANVPTAAQNNLDIAGLVSLIFKIVVPLAGAALLVLLLFGGFTYLTSAGNDEQVEKAKKIMTQAVIGIVIVAFSFGIGIWIINILGISSSIKDASSTTPTQAPSATFTFKGMAGSILEVKCESGTSGCVLVDNYIPGSTNKSTLQTASSTKAIQIQPALFKGNLSDNQLAVLPQPALGSSTSTTSNQSTDTTTNSQPATSEYPNLPQPSQDSTGDETPVRQTYPSDTTQKTGCAWYKKVLHFVGLAKCGSSNTNTSNPTFSGQSQMPTISGQTSGPTFSGQSQTPTISGQTSGPTFSGQSQTPTFSGQTPSAPPTIIQSATVNEGDSVKLSVGISYDITITTPDGKSCTTSTTITNIDKIIWSKPAANGSGQCSTTFLDNLAPTPGTVKVKTLSSTDFRPVDESKIYIADPANSSKQYLKGQSKKGWTSFNIDKPGIRETLINTDGFLSCKNNIYYSAGVNITLLIEPLTGDNNRSLPTDCNPTVFTPKASQESQMKNSPTISGQSSEPNSQTKQPSNTNVVKPGTTLDPNKVNITVYDISNSKLVSGTSIEVADKDISNTLYLKGRTSNGFTSFTIDKPGTKGIYVYTDNYNYCKNNVYLSNGISIILFVTPLSNPTNNPNPHDCKPAQTSMPTTTSKPAPNQGSSSKTTTPQKTTPTAKKPANSAPQTYAPKASDPY